MKVYLAGSKFNLSIGFSIQLVKSAPLPKASQVKTVIVTSLLQLAVSVMAFNNILKTFGLQNNFFSNEFMAQNLVNIGGGGSGSSGVLC